MEGVATFVEEGNDIIMNSDSIYENKGLTSFGERGLVSAGRFALARSQVEKAKLIHGFELGTELGVDLREDIGSLCYKVTYVIKWL